MIKKLFCWAAAGLILLSGGIGMTADYGGSETITHSKSPYQSYQSGAESSRTECDQLSGLIAGTTMCADIWSRVVYTDSSISDAFQYARFMDTKVNMTTTDTVSVFALSLYNSVASGNTTDNPNLHIIGLGMAINHFGSGQVGYLTGIDIAMELEQSADATATMEGAKGVFINTTFSNTKTVINNNAVGVKAGFGSTAPNSITGDIVAFLVGGMPTYSGQTFGYYSGDTDAVFYSAGRAGIGTDDTPNATLHVQTASSGQNTPNAGADDFVVEGSGNTGISILAGTNNNAKFSFGDSDDADSATIVVDMSSSEGGFTFKTKSDSNGVVLIGTRGADLAGLVVDISDSDAFIVRKDNSGAAIFQADTTGNQITVGASTAVTCIMMQDNDGAGWTEINTLNGAWVITSDADGVCDGS